MAKFEGPKNREILSQSLKQKTESLKIKIYLNKIKGKTTGTRFVENEIRGMLPSQKVKPRKRSSREENVANGHSGQRSEDVAGQSPAP